ncbi:MAG: hypothetical protein K0R00_3456 [Herbinix sp.]|nr:hypothetical protein [Herbinix sp.]
MINRRGWKKYLHRFRLFLGVFLFFSIFVPSQKVQASNGLPEDINYDEIQEVIDDVLGNGTDFSFSSYINKLTNQEETFSFSGIANQLLNSVKGEISENLSTLGNLITISLIAALFTNFSMAFKNNNVSETGFYVTYLLMFGLLISSFVIASRIATTTIAAILDFMKALVPTYLMSVAFTSERGHALKACRSYSNSN